MKRNMGNVDRAVRAFVVAPVAVIAGILLGPSSIAAIVLFVIAGIMVATSAVGFCPLYAPLGISSCRRTGAGSRGGLARG
jgi:Protein of unknown function (DUF2892)